MKSYIAIVAHNGVVVIDETPEAEIRFSNMKYIEERWFREKKYKQKILNWLKKEI